MTLKEKLATLRDELAEATKHFNTESSLTLNLKAHITSQTGTLKTTHFLQNIRIVYCLQKKSKNYYYKAKFLKTKYKN